MLRPVSLLPALVAVASMAAWLGVPLAGPLAEPAAGAAVAGKAAGTVDTEPLSVTIDSLSPSTIPRKGAVHVSGSVTNNDDQTWTSVTLYAFVSDTPMTTTGELADASDVPVSQFLGGRIIDPGHPGTFDAVDELAPGETAQYALRIPRSLLPDADGVYWFGVHALGFNDDGGDNLADGRARTFLPLVSKTKKTVDTALVVPIRHAVRHEPDGRLADTPRWEQALSKGRLHSLVDFGVAAGSRPVTWLVDPAVVDAASALAAGNPPRSLDATIDPDSDPSGDASDSPSPSDSASPGSDDSAQDNANPTAEQEAASSWLDRLHTGLEDSQVLSLPYGDVDVSGAAVHDPAAYRSARKRSGDSLEPWGLSTTPAVSSPSGYLSLAGLGITDSSSTVIVTDRMLGDHAPTVADTEGHTLVVASSDVATGGPGPDDPLSSVAMRQRILGEAALRLLSEHSKPLVVVFPSTWAPDMPNDFFEGLDADWLHLTDVRGIAAAGGSAVSADKLDYPALQQHLELDAADFSSADELARSGESLQNLLTLNDQVGDTVQDEAFSNLSYANRLQPGVSASSSDQSRDWIDRHLQSVHINAPKAVILSSGSGRFSATVTNDLDQPVTVKVEAVTDPPLRVSVPADGIDLAAGQRTTVLLNASSSAVGIRNVTLLLTDTAGVPLGTSDDVPIRSNRVSNVIWLILGTGVALLFGAIFVRLFRRIRAAARS